MIDDDHDDDGQTGTDDKKEEKKQGKEKAQKKAAKKKKQKKRPKQKASEKEREPEQTNEKDAHQANASQSHIDSETLAPMWLIGLIQRQPPLLPRMLFMWSRTPRRSIRK